MCKKIKSEKNIIVSIRVLTKKNTMTTSIKNDLDRLPNLFHCKGSSKHKEYTFKKPVDEKLETAAPKKLRNCQYWIFWALKN